ncbi:MAG TPA: hypothetical protein PKJ99_16280 [Thermoanaerobaculales bacterium]|nr:hypothetical protein [Thermoanaerobaculales bacterium]HPA80714.1 hypothetical protein [Thermoanaerobaculales bacterium]HQL29249.1 hypothetical protein [Thermoanaerobaculales bacterium]HQN96191.1 hypothetical protein [Thermoanaerobaculales bacterium]HQP43414.1 hypothetical protein [Thermoanaerobaculales bacterium]
MTDSTLGSRAPSQPAGQAWRAVGEVSHEAGIRLKEEAVREASRRSVPALGFAIVLSLGAAPAAAQLAFEPLLDRFSVRLEGSLVAMSTELGLQPEGGGITPVLNFEDDLDLDGSKLVPSLSFDWQIARRHKLAVRWQDVDRDSATQALTEIEWAGQIIPVEADIRLGFDITQYFVDYAYFPWVEERWAAGFGLGFRIMEITTVLSWESANGEHEGSTDATGTGPLPYLYLEYRRLLSDDWRLIAGAGWLSVELGDIDGSQWVGRLGAEYLLGEHWGFGMALNYSTVDVDWDDLESEAGDRRYTGIVVMDINDVSVFVRGRF